VTLRTGPAATPAAVARIELMAALRAASTRASTQAEPTQAEKAQAMPAATPRPAKIRKQPASSAASPQTKHRKRASP